MHRVAAVILIFCFLECELLQILQAIILETKFLLSVTPLVATEKHQGDNIPLHFEKIDYPGYFDN